MNNRAYSLLEVRSVDEDKRIIRGIATTPTVDRVGDIIDPLGVKFTNPMAFLWQHRHDQPIGSVKFDKPSKSGIQFEAEIAKTDEPGTLKDRLDEAWQSIKMGLVRAVSIGFRPIEYSFMDSGGIKFQECEVYELSAVTIPANSEALITAVKSLAPEALLQAVKQVDDHDRWVANVKDDPLPEIPSEPEPPAPERKGAVVVRLGAAAKTEAPFVINKIHRERKP